ncbi:uncharacterized protein LOC132195808 [Neocloeon triangulifer]|uniref:uncharacterized protein LOC132195808 n=1 Tax=Neocloeon triangulifer TaxID=2078957 RepID=UPI00286EBA87|nr:uncharacterized protein LOC132195808 [Neocloeon triangulifer]
MAGRRATLSAFKRPLLLCKLLLLALVGAVLGLHVDVFPWVFQLGGHHQALLVHAAAGVVTALAALATVAHLLLQPLPPLLESAFDVVGGCLMCGASGVLLSAWVRRADASAHDVLPGLHADGFLDADKLATAGFLALAAALLEFAQPPLALWLRPS